MPASRCVSMTVVCAVSCSLAALVVIASPALVSAHSAGQLDPRGCHDDRRRGEYHCHVGEYRGLTFRSRSDLQTQVEGGKSVADMRKDQGLEASGGESVEEEDEGWLSWVPFVGDRDSKMRDVGSGDVIVPRGIEERLRVLNDLREKGLITEEEYATKRAEILGDL